MRRVDGGTKGAYLKTKTQFGVSIAGENNCTARRGRKRSVTEAAGKSRLLQETRKKKFSRGDSIATRGRPPFHTSPP